MTTEIIQIAAGDKFIKLEVSSITQKEHNFFVGKLMAKDFLSVYTVRPTVYDIHKNTSLSQTFVDDREYYDYLITQGNKNLNEKGFQRDYDNTRVNKIANFLENEEFPFFPNTIIASCDLINDIEELGMSTSSSFTDFIQIPNRPSHFSFLEYRDSKFYLYIPYRENTILVIDGQHRLKGLEKCSERLINNYELLISFIIGVDRSVVAKLFYTINYEQKSVNKSLLYHLTGEFSTELNELTFMHNAVKVLNELEYSPFFGKVKMLGINPKEATREEKDKLTISQAFLIDYLIKTISKNSKNSLFQPIFLYYFQHEDFQIEIIRFLIKYFSAIRELQSNNWENPTTNILTKGVGISAFIRVLHLLFMNIFIVDWQSDPTQIKNITTEDLLRKLEGIEDVDFSKEGEFGGVGSGGSINKLTERIIEKLPMCRDLGLSYHEFIQDFKNSELQQFKSWLNKNTKI